MKNLSPLLTFLMILLSANGNSADIKRTGPNIFVSGEIDQFTHILFQEQLLLSQKEGNPVVAVYLDSPGGNLDSAIKMANLTERYLLQTFVSGTSECHSACAFIYIAGSIRINLGKIGLHRPYFGRGYFSELSYDEAKAQYNNLLESASDWLKERYVPQDLIDKMIQTSSQDMYIIPREANVIPAKSPVATEWLAARCGMLPSHDRELFNFTSMLLDPAHRKDFMMQYNQGLPGNEQLFDAKLVAIARSYLEPYDPIDLAELYKRGQAIDICAEKSIIEERTKRMAADLAAIGY